MKGHQEEMRSLPGAITHLFLPKRLPGAAEPDLETVEKFILRSVTRSVCDALGESGFSELAEIKNLLRTWEELQPHSNRPEEEDNFVETFVKRATLPILESIPIYVRKQNCTLLLEPEEDGGVQLKTFRSVLPAGVVMSRVAPIPMEFPQTCHVIRKTDLLSSQSFARTLYRLAVEEQEMAQPLVGGGGGGATYSDWRDAPEPFLVSQWLVGSLAPEETRKEYVIRKKVRDQVTMSPTEEASGSLPFRRSGLWMSVKVVLQLKLLELFKGDQPSARLAYKLLILRVLTDLGEKYHCAKEEEELDFNLVAQMLVKLELRVGKLGQLLRSIQSSRKEILILHAQVLKRVEIISKNLYGYAELRLFPSEGAALPSQLYSPPARSQEDYLNDLNHILPPSLFKNLHGQKSLVDVDVELAPQTTAVTADMRESLKIPRYPTIDLILAGAGSLSGHYNRRERIWLYDTETFMKTQLELEPNSTKINQLVQTYVRKALELYEGNPIGTSQMVLVVLKAVQVLDERAVEAYPVVRGYQSGIDCEAMDYLLLPQKEDMDLLEDILDYFYSRRWLAIKQDGILTEEVGRDCFAVRFAEENTEMIQFRESIILKAKDRVKAKLEEVRRVREECYELQRRIHQEKDSSARYELSQKRRQVEVLERPLSKADHLQKAVVFEILIPQLVNDLRDCLAIFKFSLLQEPPITSHPGKVKWMEYLRCFHSLQEGSNGLIILGSPDLNAAATDQYRLRNPDLLASKEDAFIVENGMDGRYSYSFSCKKPDSDADEAPGLESLCAFDLDTADSSDQHFERYDGLQPFLQSWTHSADARVDAKFACYPNLFQEEIDAFISVRKGGPIGQLRRLYSELRPEGDLTLGEEPILQLVLQVIWQLGPRDSEGRRETHLDFQEDDDFSSEMLDMLEKWLGVYEKASTFSTALVPVMSVAITVRVMELNRGQFERGYLLLKRWRKVAIQWARNIQLELENGTDKQSKQQDRRELELQKKDLIISRICVALSFNFSPGLVKWDGVMLDGEDVSLWLHSIHGLNLREMARYADQILPFMEVLLNVARNVALQLKLQDEVMTHPRLGEGLRLFICQNWKKAEECDLLDMDYVSERNTNLIRLNYMDGQGEKFAVTFDLISGALLVDGYAQTCLPNEVTQDPSFQKYFGKAASHLRVRRGKSVLVYRTAEKFHGSHFRFQVSGQGVIIKERSEDGTVLTMLDSSKLLGTLSSPLFGNYTHWFDPKKNIIYFREIRRYGWDFDCPPDSKYKLVKRKSEKGKWLLYSEKNNTFLLSFKSRGYQAMSKALERLELSQYVEVMMEEGTQELTVHLPRYGLRFSLREEGLECREHPGFFLVGGGASEGTLLGLEQGIQLRKGKEQRWLIPNGNISFLRKPKSLHQTVKIDLRGELGYPRHFTYEVDEVGRRLVPIKNERLAWLYLAALHGVTSTPLPDPLTGLTGTEMAVRILKSGEEIRRRGSSYYSGERRILDFIKGLAPKRTYYGHADEEMKKWRLVEIVEWPEGLPSMAAYDGYRIIVDKLLHDSLRLEEKCPWPYQEGTEKTETEAVPPLPSKLVCRNYLRHRNLYGVGGTVGPRFFPTALSRKLEEMKGFVVLNLEGTRGHQFDWDGLVTFAHSTLSSRERSSFFSKDNLDKFLLSDDQPPPQSFFGVNDIFTVDLSSTWFALYGKATEKGKGTEDRHSLDLILSFLAYKKETLGQLINLHYISEFADKMDFPPPPPQESQAGEELRGFVADVQDKLNRIYDELKEALGHKDV